MNGGESGRAARPSQRVWIIAGLSAAVLIAVGAFVLTQLPAPESGTAGSRPVADTSARPSTSSGTPAPAPHATDAPGSATSAPSPTAGKRYSTEVMPANPQATPALPPSTPLPYPVSGPLPASASASGRLVAGFPAAVLPQAPDSRIASSSIATQAPRLQVALEAHTGQGVAELLAFYRTALAQYGMYDSPAPAAAGSTAVTFSRDGDSVTVTATPETTGTSYVIYGAFTARS